jgi:integrase
MGTLRDGLMKRGNTWSFVIRVTDERTGVSKPKWAGGFATEAAAKEARDSARVAARQGVYVDRSRITVTQYLGDWLDAHAMEIKPATLSTYRYLVTHYVDPHIGRMRLQSVRPTTLSGLYRDLLVHGGKEARPLSRATVDYVHAILRKAFNDAVRSEQLLVTNPAERAKRPRSGPRGLLEVWTAEQLRTFLNAASHHRLSAFFRVAAYTGARRGEVSNLRWADIDWDAPALRVKGSVGIIAGQRVEGTTKSGRERLVSLDAGTVDVLRDLRRKQVENQLALGDAWTETGHVFTSGDGMPINPDSMTALMAKTIRRTTPLSRRRCRHFRWHGSTTFGTFMPRSSCWPACLCMWSPTVSDTRTRRSPSGSMPMSCASTRRESPMCLQPRSSLAQAQRPC